MLLLLAFVFDCGCHCCCGFCVWLCGCVEVGDVGDVIVDSFDIAVVVDLLMRLMLMLLLLFSVLLSLLLMLLLVLLLRVWLLLW